MLRQALSTLKFNCCKWNHYLQIATKLQISIHTCSCY